MYITNKAPNEIFSSRDDGWMDDKNAFFIYKLNL